MKKLALTGLILLAGSMLTAGVIAMTGATQTQQSVPTATLNHINANNTRLEITGLNPGDRVHLTFSWTKVVGEGPVDRDGVFRFPFHASELPRGEFITAKDLNSNYTMTVAII